PISGGRCSGARCGEQQCDGDSDTDSVLGNCDGSAHSSKDQRGCHNLTEPSTEMVVRGRDGGDRGGWCAGNLLLHAPSAPAHGEGFYPGDAFYEHDGRCGF